jgi:hypothetical protein
MDMLPQLDELLIEIVAVAWGDTSRRPAVEAHLHSLEAIGWHLLAPVQRIWAGERDARALKDSLDEADARFIDDLLDTLGVIEPYREEAAPGAPPAILDIVLPSGLAAAQPALLLSLPIGVRLAVLEENPQAMQAALAALPGEQAEHILAQLAEAGFVEAARQPLATQSADELEPILHAIAAAARGDPDPRRQAEDFLAYLESQGLHLEAAIRQLWDGERDAAVLCQGLSEGEAVIVQDILELAGE